MDLLVFLVILIGIVSSLFSRSNQQNQNRKTHHVHNASASDEPLHHETIVSGGETGKQSLRERIYQESRMTQERLKAEQFKENEQKREQQDQKNRQEEQARKRQEENRKAAELRAKEAEKRRREAERQKKVAPKNNRITANSEANTASFDDNSSAAAMFETAMQQTHEIGEIDISGCMDEVYDMIACGYTPDLPVQRDFLAEAEDMLAGYTL